MNAFLKLLTSSLGKKYLMAVTGIIWVGFVFGHLAGNLQLFLDPYYLNAYAHKLQTLPYGLLWVARLSLLAALSIHVWTAILLVLENKKARPVGYAAEGTVQASFASRTMKYTGFIVLLFIIFHLAHYTVRIVPGHEYNEVIAMADGTLYASHVPLENHGEVVVDKYGKPLEVHDVHTMTIAGFSYVWISAFYIIAIGLLCMHLSHGVSSMFQSLGLRNEGWRKRLNLLARAVAVIVFLGFISIPVAVLLGVVEPQATPLPETFMSQH